MERSWRYLVIEGNIGAGKTTLSTMLSESMNTSLVLEQFSDNPFLPGFYEDPSKYAFPLELSFLAERYQQLKDVFSKPDIFKPQTISDYFILKSLIFAQINLPDLEFDLFNKMFRIIRDSLPMPDLLVFLYSDKERLKQNIIKRGRSYEMNIRDEYLLKIQNGYFEILRTLEEVPVVVIDVTNIDFVADKAQFEKIQHIINQPHPNGVQYVNL